MQFKPFRDGVLCGGILTLFLLGFQPALAEDLITQEYILKNTEAPMVIRALLMVVPNPTGKHIISGQGKRLVVTDAIEQQAQVMELLPIIDQPIKETDEKRAYMMMVQNVMRYYREKRVTEVVSRKGAAATGQIYRTPDASGVKSYDLRKSSYSVYAKEDARLARMPRRIADEPTLPSLSGLKLKGLFETHKGAPIALLSYGEVLFTARDGGLFERNRVRVKGVISQVRKDRVILTGPDRIPREIKFASTL